MKNLVKATVVAFVATCFAGLAQAKIKHPVRDTAIVGGAVAVHHHYHKKHQREQAAAQHANTPPAR